MRILHVPVFVLAFASVAWAEYKLPEYPKSPDRIGRIELTCPRDLKAGATLRVSFRITATQAIDAPRLFLHVEQDGKVYHVAVFKSDVKIEPNRSTELGPFETSLPVNLPGGEYKLIGGVYAERESAEQQVTLAGPSDAPRPLIINTGVFVDKSDTPHRWHVSETHTLYWDGEPFIPVGGMMIPDDRFETFKAQIDLLVKNNVRDVYFNVGNSMQMPHTWETKSDEKLRYFQKCVDYMDEVGMRYGMEFSGLQAHGYGYELMGGREVAFTIKAGQAEPQLENSNDDQWLKDGKLNVSYRKVREGYYLISQAATGKIIESGSVEIVHDDRKSKEGKDRGSEEQVVRVTLPSASGQAGKPALEAGEYKVYLTVSSFHDGWNMNMHYWGEDTAKYYQAIRDLYSKIRMGPGFRFVVDAFWNENNFNHGIVPAEDSFRTRHAAYLKGRYGTIEKLRAAWKPETPEALADFQVAANLLPLRGVQEKPSGVSWDYLLNVKTKELLRVSTATSQFRYDLLESISKQVRDYHIEMADLVSGLFDVPVVFKFFSGMDMWHINDAGIAGGHDGVGMETYGLGEPQLAFMGIPALSSCRQSTKTMWLLVTEVGEGNHQDQAFARNKLFGCTSRLGTMYPMYASLLAGGAKGIYHYYMVPSPGADRFWEDSTLRDPRQLEWMGTFARMVDSAADRVADYVPTVYYRFPALMQPNSGLLYSDPHRDYFNTDCLWWVDPAGKLPNGAWMLPTFSLNVPTEMMFINLENAPATLRYAEQVNTYLKGKPRVTWLGYRKDLGTIPAVDQYYTPEFAVADDGIEFQVLKPGADCRVIGKNRDGKAWNIMVGNLQIISKNAENKTGWRPDRVVLDGKNHRYDYSTYMRETLGVERVPCDVDAFSFREGDRRITVVSLKPEVDKTVQIGDAFPAWSLDATGNPGPAFTIGDVRVGVRSIPEGTTATYACGDPIQIPETGKMDLVLRPDKMVLTKSEGKPEWAREGFLFDTSNSHAAAIFSSPVTSEKMTLICPQPSVPRPGAWIEAEKSVESNFNMDTFSGLGGLSNDGMLGLATQIPPPSPDGYVASWSFEVAQSGTYVLRVRESYLANVSPGRYRIDDGAWAEADNTYVPEDIRIVAQYNALDDERMVFAWYTYGKCELSAGKHRLTYSVVAKRPGGLDIGLQNSTPYCKLLDCFEFVLADDKQATSPKINLLANPSLEQDTGGWTAEEWTGDRWKWFELRDEQGWNRDFWWTRKVGGEGRIFIDGMMDLGGMTVRQSYVGVRSLRIRAGEKPRRFSSSPIAVTPGESIGFGGFARLESLHAKADLSIRFIDADGKEIVTVSSKPLQGDTHWQEIGQPDVKVPENARAAVLDCTIHESKRDLSRFGRKWQDTAWFDELYLARNPAMK